MLFMQNVALLPFRVINPKTCEIMGLELSQTLLGTLDVSRNRIDIMDHNFNVYMTLDTYSVIPVNVCDVSKYSVLSKMYAAYHFIERDMSNHKYSIDSYSDMLGVTPRTLKTWVKNYENKVI